VGSIEAIETRREGKRPERTVYRLTEAGEQQMLGWLREMIATPVREPTSFFAALSFLPHLPPEHVQELLQQRVRGLEAEIGTLQMVLTTMTPKIGRLVLVEVEYLLALQRAELSWVQSLLEDLRTGRLTWSPQAACEMGAAASLADQSEDAC